MLIAIVAATLMTLLSTPESTDDSVEFARKSWVGTFMLTGALTYLLVDILWRMRAKRNQDKPTLD